MKKITIVLALLCLNFSVLKAQELSENAKSEIAKNNFRPAIEELNTFLSANPNSEIALTYRANFLAKTGEFDKSITDANKALSINPKNLNALIVSGSAKVSKNNFSDGIADFTKALAIQPNLKPALMFRAQAYFKMGDDKKAISDLDFAIKDDPKNMEAYLYRARINVGQNKLTEALADYNFIKNNSQSGTRFYDVANKELDATNQKISSDSKNAENKKIEQENQAKNAEYLKKIGDDMNAMSKELNDATTRLKPLADSQTQLTNEFTTKLNALKKEDFAGKMALYKDMNAKLSTMVSKYEKELAQLKDKESLKPLQKSMQEILETLKNLVHRTRPYAARYNQYVTENNALSTGVFKDIEKLIINYNNRNYTNFATEKQVAIASTEKIIALNNDAKNALSKFNDPQFKDKNEAEMTSLIETYQKKLDEIKVLKSGS